MLHSKVVGLNVQCPEVAQFTSSQKDRLVLTRNFNLRHAFIVHTYITAFHGYLKDESQQKNDRKNKSSIGEFQSRYAGMFSGI